MVAINNGKKCGQRLLNKRKIIACKNMHLDAFGDLPHTQSK